MKINVAFVLFLVLSVVATSSAAADASTSLVDDEEDMGRKLGFNVMNRKKSEDYWEGVYKDCCQGSKKRRKKRCDCPVRFVRPFKKKWNRSCRTTIKDRAGK